MTVFKYPEFKPGQTLTAEELNLLEKHVWNRDQLVGRMIGFGINGGLTGTFSGSQLTIDPGLAVDQRGEPLVMTSAKTLTFSSSMSPLPVSTYNFLGAQADTYSVVLYATDTPDPLEGCTEVGCAGHSTKHTRGVDVHVVSGRLNGARFDFAANKVLEIVPLWLSASGQPVGNLTNFKKLLKDALDSLNPPLPPALVAKVQAVSIPNTDLMGVKGYKVGWLNTVLFATIDLIRCRALQSVQVFRDEATPGVVLGSVTRTGSTWTFDCAFKHFWEPPKGLSQALLGSSCASVCGASQSYLESVLDNYAPPDPPPAPSNPPTGPGHVIDPELTWCDKHPSQCGTVIIAGPLIQDKYLKIPRDLGDPSPIELALDPRVRVQEQMRELLNKPDSNPFGDGVLVIDTLLGEAGIDVKVTLEANIMKHGATPNVKIVSADSVGDIANVEYGNAVGLSDEIMVAVDGKGVAVGVATVPVLVAARKSALIANVATTAGTQASAALLATADLTAEVTTGFATIDGNLKALQGNIGSLQTDVMGIKGSPADAAVLVHRVSVLEQQSVKTDLLGERLSKLEGHSLAYEGALGAKNYTVDVGNTLAEFAQSSVAALKTISQADNKNLGKYIEATERAQGELELAVRAGDPDTVATVTIELLDNMRTMIGAAGVDAGAKRKLDAQFRAVKGFVQ